MRERHQTASRPGRARRNAAHALERAGVGALEAVDRLLAIADREDGARMLARPSPAKNSSASAAISPTARDWCPAPRR